MRYSTILFINALAFGLIMTFCTQATADEACGYYNAPTTNGEQVVFSAEGDLWEAAITGGLARRLTSISGIESGARYSPDGKWIAFSGNYDGNYDVYVMPSGGGEPRRLTFHPAFDTVVGWTSDGRVVFRNASDNSFYQLKCYTLPVEGGWPESLPVDEAAFIAFEPGGNRIAYTRYSMVGASWKRYRGGWIDQIFVGDSTTLEYSRVTDYTGYEAYPMWHKDRIYFLRDNDARMNIHSMKPDGSDIQQHTFHTEWDVRRPDMNGSRIAYTLGADVYIYDIESNQSRMIPIEIPSDARLTRDKFVEPDEYTNDFALSPDGKRLLLEARGEVFSAPTERRGVIKQISRTPGARERFPVFTPTGNAILAWADTPGEEALFLYSEENPGEARKVCDGTSGWNYGPVISPDGMWAVYGDSHRKLQLVHLKSGSVSTIDSSYWEIDTYCWSPDSRCIAYDVDLSGYTQQVRIYDLKEKQVHPVTDELYSSFSPAWDPKGEWLYFASSRFMNPYPSVNDWAFSALETDEIFAVALDTTLLSPWALTEDGTVSNDAAKPDKKGNNDDENSEQKNTKVKPITINWTGLQDRIIKLPVEPGGYTRLHAIEDKLYYCAKPLRGLRSEGFNEEEPMTMALHLLDLTTKKNDLIFEEAIGLAFSSDGSKIAIRKFDGFIVMDGGETELPDENEDDEDAGLHLEDWSCDVDPRLEWQQIFNEAWRLQRDFFYAENMHGIDWNAQREHYSTLLPRVRTREELSDLIGEMAGELNAGHLYFWGGDKQPDKNVGVGLLGVDVTRVEPGFYRIDHLLRGDLWDEQRCSPLAGAGLNVKEGQFIVAIDDVPTSSVGNYLELLVNKAEKPLTVSINSKPSLDGARRIAVRALADEWSARYWDWVRGRMEYVRIQGGGEIAYVHIADMLVDGLEGWLRAYYPQCDKKALIVDVRHNWGGNVAEWILSELERSVWSWGSSRSGMRYHAPSTAFHGPMVALCNAHTGSDGETFSEGFKRLNLGKLIGTRTWGGWVGFRYGKAFVDRGGHSQPEFTGWGKEGTWLIEGSGVSPDIVIENHPKQVMQGVDEQLDYAIQHLKDKLKSEIYKVPERPPFPNKAPTGYKKVN